MCGRFAAGDLTQAEMEKIIEDFIGTGRRARYNIRPKDQIEVWTPKDEGHVAHWARWWLIPSWFKSSNEKDWKATTFNARIEDAAEKPSFRGAWRHGRCLIPANGYYEWTGEKGQKQPYFLRPLSNQDHFSFAGILSQWQDEWTVAMLTRPAHPSIAHIHSRMPVIPNAVESEEWLRGENLPDLGASTGMQSYPVKRFGLQDEGEALIEPMDEF